MENNSTYRKHSFYTGIQQLLLHHDIEMNEDDYIELASVAWRKIGNKELSIYKTTEKVVNNKVELPCNVYSIEAVLLNEKDCCKQYPNDYFTETNFSKRLPESDLYVEGTFISYEWLDDYIKTKIDDVEINIYYLGIRLDDEGLPYISEEEAEAIGNYCAYIDSYKKAKRGIIPMDFVGYLENKWKMSCGNARVPSLINQNAMNEILDVNSRWDRKRYNRSFKVV